MKIKEMLNSLKLLNEITTWMDLVQKHTYVYTSY